MMSALVSQATSDAPTILVLAENSSLSKKIKQLFIDHGFEVTMVETHNYSTEQLQKLSQQQFYKIVLVYGFVETDLQIFADFFDFLKNRLEPIISITPWPRELQVLQTNKQLFYKKWLDVSQKQKEIYRNIQSLSILKIFVLDLVLTETLIEPLSFCLQSFKQQVILDPETNFALLGVDQLLSNLKKLLLQPFVPNTYFFQGKLQTSLVIVAAIKDLILKFYQKDLAVRKLGAKNTVLDPSGQPKTVIYSDLNNLIEQPLRNLKTYLEKITDTPQIDWQKLEVEYSQSFYPKVEQASPDKQQPVVSVSTVLKKTPTTLPIVTKNVPPVVKKPVNKQQIEQNLDKELSSLFGDTRQTVTIQRRVTKIKQIKKVTKKTAKKKVLFYLGLAFSILGSGIAVAFLVFILSLNSVKNSFVKATSSYLQNHDTQAWQLQSNLAIKLLDSQISFYQPIFNLSAFDEANQLIKISQQMTQWQNIAKTQTQTVQDLYLQIFAKNSNSLDASKLNSLAIQTRQLFELIAQTQAQVKQTKKATFANFKDFSLDDFNQALLALQKQNAAQLSFEQQLNKVLAIDSKKTYALLLQDNQELRPSGGFIQAIALLSFKDGQLIDYQVYDIYQLDQMVPGATDLPPEMKPYVAESKWFAHDANWSVDFPSSANRVAWFIKQATNQQVDGVLTLNYESLATLLATTGEIQLPGFNQSLDHKNFFNRVEGQIENVTNSQNQYFAQEMLEQFMTNLINLPAEKGAQILAFYFQQLENNQEFLVFFDSDLQQVIQELTWDGNLVRPQCPASFMAENCLVDSLYISETNIGLNKVNRYIQRQANHQVTFKDNQIIHHYQLDLSNTAYSNNFPFGTYKGYLRIYLPENSQLEAIKLDKNQLPTDKFTLTKVKGFNLVEVVIEVGLNQTAKLELYYSQNNPYQKAFTYVFLNQKQAGLSPTPIATSIVFDANLKPLVVAPQAEIFNSNIVFNTKSVKHDFFAIKFE